MVAPAFVEWLCTCASGVTAGSRTWILPVPNCIESLEFEMVSRAVGFTAVVGAAASPPATELRLDGLAPVVGLTRFRYGIQDAIGEFVLVGTRWPHPMEPGQGRLLPRGPGLDCCQASVVMVSRVTITALVCGTWAA